MQLRVIEGGRTVPNLRERVKALARRRGYTLSGGRGGVVIVRDARRCRMRELKSWADALRWLTETGPQPPRAA